MRGHSAASVGYGVIVLQVRDLGSYWNTGYLLCLGVLMYCTHNCILDCAALFIGVQMYSTHNCVLDCAALFRCTNAQYTQLYIRLRSLV